MRAFVSRDGGGIEDLVETEIAGPGPLGRGEVRVRLRAASLNYRDILTLGGQVGRKLPAGFIPCSDGAGEVVECAGDVMTFRPGDRVVMTFNPDWIAGPWQATPGAMGRGSGILPGVMRDEMVVQHSELVRLPAHFDYRDGAALPCAAVTAWHSLCGAGPLYPGMTVLLQGAGGVSVFALQLAKLCGARVIVTSSSAERCARLQALGADETIDYRETEAWDTAVRDLTGGTGVDVAVDVGGAETIEKTLKATRAGGRVAMVGLLTGPPRIAGSMVAASVEIQPIRVGSRADLEAVVRAMAFHDIRPVIDRTFAFSQLPEALRTLSEGRHFGKIAIGFD
jgi:NADPH:quinone reductase-like Zn-dependent oxidoreductase